MRYARAQVKFIFRQLSSAHCLRLLPTAANRGVAACRAVVARKPQLSEFQPTPKNVLTPAAPGVVCDRQKEGCSY